MRRLALVGANGSLGRRLTEYFAKLPNYEVRVLTRSLGEGADLHKNFAVTSYNPDFFSVTSLASALRGCDVVINLAGANASACIESGKAVFRDELLIQSLSEALEVAGVLSLVHISSIHVYRDQNKVNPEDPLTYENPYGINHWKKEEFLLHNARTVKVNIIRLANTFGAFHGMQGKNNSLFVNALFSQLAMGKTFSVNNMHARRDYISLTYFEHKLAVFLSKFEGNKSEVWNCHSGRLKSNAAISLEIINFLEKKTGKKVKHLINIESILQHRELMTDIIVGGGKTESNQTLKASYHSEFERLYAAYCQN